ncbi:expressed unknown protein (Partial), partial [Seminavis robusta]
MDVATVRSLCASWLTLSDAMALRCVSRGWRETLDEKDDPLWDNLIDVTHGAETAAVLRRSFAPTRGWQLAQLIHHEDEDDRPIMSSLNPEDVVLMIEFSWRNHHQDCTRGKRRKINLASFVLEDACDSVTETKYRYNGDGSIVSISIPNPHHKGWNEDYLSEGVLSGFERNL